MAPKAEKKPAKKKPTEEKKSIEKKPAEKKPKAGKKLPKEGGAAVGDKKKKRLKKSTETYKIYIFKGSAIDFLTLCHRLKTTKRKGWINRGRKGPESIADHMYRMALMALISGDLPGVDRERYWVTKMHVDGFRFDLASIMTKGSSLWDAVNVFGNPLEGDVMTTGIPLSSPPLIEMISNDPILREVKLVAEAWDTGGLYQVGSFLHWHVWS